MSTPHLLAENLSSGEAASPGTRAGCYVRPQLLRERPAGALYRSRVEDEAARDTSSSCLLPQAPLPEPLNCLSENTL